MKYTSVEHNSSICLPEGSDSTDGGSIQCLLIITQEPGSFFCSKSLELLLPREITRSFSRVGSSLHCRNYHLGSAAFLVLQKACSLSKWVVNIFVCHCSSRMIFRDTFLALLDHVLLCIDKFIEVTKVS